MAASAFTNIFKIPELRKRLFFSLGMLAVYRLGIYVTTPGVDRIAMKDVVQQGNLLGLLNFFYFATDLTRWDVGNTEFGGVLVRLERTEPRISTRIEGPYDPRYEDYRRLSLPMDLEPTADRRALKISVQGREQTVAEGSWSDWFDFRFRGGMFVDVRGISRFYVLEVYPEIRLYLEPISMDPRNPPVPISSPPGFSTELVRRLGLFKTLGWIHETWGLNEEKIGEKIFLEDMFRNMDSLEAAVLDQLNSKPPLLVAVFTATDSVSHTFFRFLDRRRWLHPEVSYERMKDGLRDGFAREKAPKGAI